MSSHLSRRHPGRRAARALFRKRVEEITDTVERMSPEAAKEALLRVCRDYPDEVLESLEYKGPRS